MGHAVPAAPLKLPPAHGLETAKDLEGPAAVFQGHQTGAHRLLGRQILQSGPGAPESAHLAGIAVGQRPAVRIDHRQVEHIGQAGGLPAAVAALGPRFGEGHFGGQGCRHETRTLGFR